MIKNIENIGYNIYGNSLGEIWISLVEAILKNGEISYDEKRKRKALVNVRIKSESQETNDKIINKYADQEKLNAMIDFTMSKDIIEDIDVVKSFQKGAKSYHQRIVEGRMIEFVIKRLSKIPESKKAIIVFPTYEDYAKIFDDQYINDYLPCIVSIQFRLVEDKEGYILNTNFYARSIDAYQKSHGNFISIAKLSSHIAEELTKILNKKVKTGFLDGMIADAHIYEETFKNAEKTVKSYHSEEI
ncbi:Thymidylate synthase [uncultured archaeon]|nr:Thymidylate synthase [uncultured archaeon]